MKRLVFLIALSLVGAGGFLFSQNIDEMRKRFEDFKNQNRKEFVDFRNQCNKEYAEFMRAAWEKFGSKPPVEKPEEVNPVEPIEYKAPDPKVDKPKEQKIVEFDEVVEIPAPQPRPQPVSPILEKPAVAAPVIDGGKNMNDVKQQMQQMQQKRSKEMLEQRELMNQLEQQQLEQQQREQELLEQQQKEQQLLEQQKLQEQKQQLLQQKLQEQQLKEQQKQQEKQLKEQQKQQEKQLKEQQKQEKQDKNSKVKVQIPATPVVPAVAVVPVPADPVSVEPKEEPVQYFEFDFLGAKEKVRLAENQKVVISKLKEGAIADAWEKYSSGEYDNLIFDCLKLRDERNLCDWAYLAMLHEMSSAYYGSDKNSATLMAAYIYCQSGYQVRLGMGDNGTRLVMLYACHHLIFSKNYFPIDGHNYYAYDYTGESLNICRAKFPKEQPMSLDITKSLLLDGKDVKERKVQSKRYADAGADIGVNKNLIGFYDKYPVSMVGENIMTRWAIYANTPLNLDIVDELYPSLRKSVVGKSEAEALNILLNFVQTAFEYEYDNKVWGRDRIFFAEETLYYPFADCEDRSILFSRLVRDILGLEVMLVYYPGHLATAVKLNEKVRGDYIVLNGNNYIVCDPTYINAPIGETMPNMDNSKAKLIILN